MIRGTKPYDERLKELGMFREMTALFKDLKGSHPEEGQDLFSIIPEWRTGNNRFKLKEANFG